MDPIVGQLFVPSVTSWPDRVGYDFVGGSHNLTIFQTAPSESMVQAISRGMCEFALYVEMPAIVFLYRFQTPLEEGEEIDWSDTPYSWYKLPPHMRSVRPLPPESITQESRAVVRVHLIDAQTGVLLALRKVCLSLSMSKLLHQAIVEQIALPIGEQEYETALDDLYSRFVETEQFLLDSQARCTGEDV